MLKYLTVPVTAFAQNCSIVWCDETLYAVAHPEMLQAVGCYCGCGGMGHTSNYSCFVAGQDLTGATVYDGHALGCSICVDIARDVERLAAEGRDMRAIQEYIDAEYSKYGPSNLSR